MGSAEQAQEQYQDGMAEVTVGQKYLNPYDGASGPTITIIHVDGGEAVCAWRYCNSKKNPLKVFAKSCNSILQDWHLIP